MTQPVYTTLGTGRVCTRCPGFGGHRGRIAASQEPGCWGRVRGARGPWPRECTDHTGSCFCHDIRAQRRSGRFCRGRQGISQPCSGLIIFPEEMPSGCCPLLRTAICYGGFSLSGHDPLFAVQLLTQCHVLFSGFLCHQVHSGTLCVSTWCFHPVTPICGSYSLKINKGLSFPSAPWLT